jgi:hypothetical protein
MELNEAAQIAETKISSRKIDKLDSPTTEQASLFSVALQRSFLVSAVL